jgi:hypothetical protein
MIGRFIEQQQAICGVFVADRSLWHLNPSDADYKVLEEIYSVLSQLVQFTDMLSGETYVSVSAIIPVLKHIYEILSPKKQDPANVKVIKSAIMKDLKPRFDQQEVKEISMKACVLDPRFKDGPFKAANVEGNQDSDDTTSGIEELKVSIIAEAEKMKADRDNANSSTNGDVGGSGPSADNADSAENVDPDDPTPAKRPRGSGGHGLSSILRTITKKYKSAASVSLSSQEQAQRELTTYLQSDTIDSDSDPLVWWRQSAVTFPMLAVVAKKYLCIPATSVASERLFSGAGQIVTPLRNRLDQENVNKMLFLSKNLE